MTTEEGRGVGLRAVRLEIWGFTPRDAETARISVSKAPDGATWQIVGAVENVGLPRTVTPGDPEALAQGTDYEWLWSAYQVPAGAAG